MLASFFTLIFHDSSRKLLFHLTNDNYQIAKKIQLGFHAVDFPFEVSNYLKRMQLLCNEKRNGYC